MMTDNVDPGKCYYNVTRAAKGISIDNNSIGDLYRWKQDRYLVMPRVKNSTRSYLQFLLDDSRSKHHK